MFIREEWKIKKIYILLNSEDIMPFLLKRFFETENCIKVDLLK